MRSPKCYPVVFCMMIIVMMLIIPEKVEAATAIPVYSYANGTLTYSDASATKGKEYIGYVIGGLQKTSDGLTFDSISKNLVYIDQTKAGDNGLSLTVSVNSVNSVQTLCIAPEGGSIAPAAFLLPQGSSYSGLYTSEAATTAITTTFDLDEGTGWEDIEKLLAKEGYAVYSCGVKVPVAISFSKPEGFETLSGNGITITAAVSSKDAVMAGFLSKLGPSGINYTIRKKSKEDEADTGSKSYRINVMSGAKATKNGSAVTTAKKGETIDIEWTEKDGFEFSKWIITGASARDSAAKKTSFTMGEQDVTVKFEEKLKETVYEDEELPEEAEKNKEIKVKSLKFSKKKLVIYSDSGSVSNQAIPVMKEGTAPDTYYTSSNADIVAVTAGGTFYPMGSGNATVTAYCGNKKAKCSVKVIKTTEAISITDENGAEVEDSTISLYSGEQAQYTVNFDPYDSNDPRQVAWKSDNKKVSVQNGIVTAKNVKEETEAKITATVKATDTSTGKVNKKIERSFTIKVLPVELQKASAADKSHTLALKKKSIKMITNQDKDTAELIINLTAKGRGLTCDDLEITDVSSSNEEIVEVTELSEIEAVNAKGTKGKATATLSAKRAGTAYIVVKSSGSDEKENVKLCKITVKTPAESISAESGTLELSESDSQKTLTMRKGSCGTINAVLSPAYSTDIGKVKIKAKGGVSIKKGVIYANKITKSNKPATITLQCGKLKDVVKVTVTK